MGVPRREGQERRSGETSRGTDEERGGGKGIVWGGAGRRGQRERW